MEASFKILFLGWWMLGQWWMSRGEFSKPSISVHPKGMVALGGNVSIHCRTQGEQCVEFYLTKDVNSNLSTPEAKDAKPYKVIFPFVNVTKSDGGKYWCLYHFKQDPNNWSPQSDIVYINLTDPTLPKPSIKMIPTRESDLGLNVTIQCRGAEKGLTFALQKGSMQIAFQTTDAERDTAEFPFFMLKMKDAGSYTCQYHHRSNPFVWSEPSEPAELVLRDPTLSKPSIKMIPTRETALGLNVTIQCRGAEKGLTFALQKGSMQIAFQTTDAERDTAEFPFFMLKMKDAGSYTCQYHHRSNPFVWSEPSEPAELVLRDGSTATIPVIMLVSIAAGLLFLVLFLLLLACVLQRRKKKGSIAEEGSQPMNKPLELDAGEEPDEVSYAVLNHQSRKTKQAPNLLDRSLETCVYASVAKN